MLVHSLLLLSVIPLCGFTIFFVYWMMNIWVVSSFLATMNNTVINICVSIVCRCIFSFLLGT